MSMQVQGVVVFEDRFVVPLEITFFISFFNINLFGL
jgi:hypothetical protein